MRYTVMKHDTIKFSSMSFGHVDFYETLLKDTTLDDIKKNRVEGRHALLLNMWLAGDAPASEDYMRVRGKLSERVEKELEPYKKKSTLPLVRDAVRDKVAKEIEEETGWVI